MKIKVVNEKNEKFQKTSAQLLELSSLGEFSKAVSEIIRNLREIQVCHDKLEYSETEDQFSQMIDRIEHHLDEIIYILDNLEMTNRKRNLRKINDFLARGDELISTYFLWLDKLVEKRILMSEEE